MQISRRQFHAAAGCGLALTVLGCGKKQRPTPAPTAKLANEPFLAGPLQQYAQAGVYEQHYMEFGVLLLSDGKRLVAISSECTHSGCLSKWQADQQQYRCPCHGSTFSSDGTNLPDAKTKIPLLRFALSPTGEGDAKQIQVDPTRKFGKDQ